MACWKFLGGGNGETSLPGDAAGARAPFLAERSKSFVSLPAARRGRSVEGGGCVGHCRCRAAGGRAGAPLPSLTPSA